MDWLVLCVFCAVYLGMFLGGIPGLALDRSGVALLGAIVLLAAGRISLTEAQAALDMPTLTLLLGLMVVSAQLRLGGFYTRVTQRLAAAGVSPPVLLALLIGVVALLSAVLANDVVCLAVAPLLVLGCRHRGLAPLPYLLALACASNIGSAATLIGNPQNMLIGEVLHLSFTGYLLTALGPALLGLAVCWGVIVLLYRGRWQLAGGRVAAPPGGAPPHDLRRSEDWPEYDAWQSWKGLIVAGLLVAAFLFTAWPRDIVALAAAGVLLCSRRMATRQMLGQVDWQLLVLFSGLFIVNHAFQATGCLPALLGHLQAAGVDPAQPGWLFALTAALSNVVSNVPAVMLLLPVVRHSSLSAAQGGALLALSSTLAGNLLLVGSIANLIVAEQAGLQGVRLSWRDHARVGVPVTLLTLALAWIGLWLAGGLR